MSTWVGKSFLDGANQWVYSRRSKISQNSNFSQTTNEHFCFRFVCFPHWKIIVTAFIWLRHRKEIKWGIPCKVFKICSTCSYFGDVKIKLQDTKTLFAKSKNSFYGAFYQNKKKLLEIRVSELPQQLILDCLLYNYFSSS